MEFQRMDLSSAALIPGKGGGFRFLKWDTNVLWKNSVFRASLIKNTGAHKAMDNCVKIIVCFLILLVHYPGAVDCDSCRFPERWQGLWFQKGSPDPIRLYNGTLSSKGTCRLIDGDKFLIENTLEKCSRCVVLHEKHPNVLQYKESHCSNALYSQTLETLCGEINGDALLYSMFRLGTPPVGCPFGGSYTFSYSRGHGDCAYPPSTVDSCTEDSRLLLRFQACAEVHGSESRTEELVCLAWWKEGSTRYLVGKLEHRVAKADEDKFRCFVYDPTEDGGYYISQSGDATCDGLFTAFEGSRTMHLTKANHPHAKCHYPDWFTTHRHWRGLDGKLAYDFSHKNGLFKVSNATTGDVIKRVVCAQEISVAATVASTVATDGVVSGTYAQYVVHVTSGCNSGYACLRIHKRAPHVVELQTTNSLSPLPSDACSGFEYDLNPSEIVTLTTQSYGSLECPLSGIFALEGLHLSRLISLDNSEDSISCAPGSAVLTSACSATDKIELKQDCSAHRRSKSFQCRGSWEDNGVNYVVATAVGTKKHICLAYTMGERSLLLSGSTEECLRNIQVGREGPIALNATNRGYCPSAVGSSVRWHLNLFMAALSIVSSIAVPLFVSR